MTREEAIKVQKWLVNNHYLFANTSEDVKASTDMAIEALKREPCEDCISRQKAILQVQKYGVGCFDAEEFSPEQCERFVIQKLNELSPVTPQEKTGHWIVHPKGIYAHLVCDKCLSRAPYDYPTNFCPICGAKMIDLEKSEEKQ